jgi:hypothetical protein
MGYSIQPITFADAPALARKAKADGPGPIDRHTRMEMLGKGMIPYVQDDPIEYREYF